MTNRSDLLRQIQTVSFYVDDLKLFLDTHPTDSAALNQYHQHSQARSRLIQEFQNAYGPLTPGGVNSNTKWTWVDDPWPWEGRD